MDTICKNRKYTNLLWHIKQAIDDGAGDGEIIEAIEVAIEMSGGPGTASARFAMNVLEYYLNKQSKK